jgi:hypothetical protein
MYIRMYQWYKKGFLPFPGSAMEQPIKIMEIFETLESAEIEQQKEKNSLYTDGRPKL